MNASWFIAKRYFRARRSSRFLSFITNVSIIGVMLGTGALIIALSIVDGFEKEIKEKVIGYTSHIVVTGYQNQSLSDYWSSIEKVRREIAEVKGIAPFVAKEGMIRSREGVDGVFLKGIDVENNVLTPRQHIVRGHFLSNRRPEGMAEIVIGEKLARRLDVAVGDKLVIFGLPAGEQSGGSPRALQLRLVGTYESGMAEYDDVYAYTHLQDAQKLFQLGDKVTGFDILVHDVNRVDVIAQQVKELLDYPHFARTVFQLYRNLFSWAELQKKLSPLLLSLIIIVATVNVIGTLLMFVLEKTSAVAILKSLGAGRRLIQRIFLLQGLSIAAVGVVLGNIIALALCWIQLRFKVLALPSDIYYMNTVPVFLKVENFVMVTLAALLICFLTSLLPSRAAAKLDPIAVFRFG